MLGDKLLFGASLIVTVAGVVVAGVGDPAPLGGDLTPIINGTGFVAVVGTLWRAYSQLGERMGGLVEKVTAALVESNASQERTADRLEEMQRQINDLKTELGRRAQ